MTKSQNVTKNYVVKDFGKWILLYSLRIWRIYIEDKCLQLLCTMCACSYYILAKYNRMNLKLLISLK